MKTRACIAFLLFSSLTACQTAATPAPILATTDTDIILSAGQTATVTDANISITFLSVSSDERCPSEIECAASGPATIHLSIRDGNGAISEEILQTFTDSNGLAPTMEFEGIKRSVLVDNYLIKVIGVLPYPKNRSSSIKGSEYRVTLQVTGN
jgi:hypothetical protein